jgi:hypothetical protein
MFMTKRAGNVQHRGKSRGVAEMTIATILMLWALVSVVTSLAMGHWLASRDLIDRFVAPMQFRLDDD